MMVGHHHDRVVVFLLFAVIFAVAYARDEYCDRYDDCLEQVETKRSYCVQLMQAQKANRTRNEEKSVSIAADECKAEHRRDEEALHGLMLRKTEEYRNCLRTKMSSAPAILDATKQQKCDSLISTWSADNDDKADLFKREASTGERGLRKNRKQGRKNRKLQRKRERMERRRNNPVRVCFVEAKKLKKSCMKISHCCTVAEDCRLDYQTSPLHDQIEIAKHTSRQSRRKCKDARDAAKKAEKDNMEKTDFAI